MTEQPDRGAGFARGSGTPRSSLWRGILGGAPVVSSAVALELGRDLVVNSFGDTEVIKTLATTLRSLAVLLVAGGLLYAGYRWYARRHENSRAARQLELLVDLDEPGVVVAGLPAPASPGPRNPDPGLNNREAAVLRELPIRHFDSTAVLAVLAAIIEVPARLPESAPPPRFPGATALLDHLVDLRVLTLLDAQRYWLSREPTVPARAEIVAEPAWAAAVWALVHDCAERASRWSVAVESTRHAPAARRWFESAEPMLHELVLGCAREDFATVLPAAAFPELLRIVDALDVWYARIGSTETAVLCAELATLSQLDDFVLQRDLIQLRAGRLAKPPPRYRPLRWATSLLARWEHDAALRALAAPTPDLSAAADRLARAWWLLPRADVGAEVCALINLAVVALRQGRLEAAQDRLDLVFAHTGGGREPGGRTHAHEIMGIVCWARGEPRRALRCWQLALTGYRALADDVGIRRCLRHLGGALMVAPEHGRVVLGAPPPDGAQVRRQAAGWLATAASSNPPDRESTIDRWPEPVADPDLEP
ncbi:tetratricopeptide repeat protein [Nocardia sp. NPDC050710]|uniref:tetratricopeptide repeat protein n=1 Tax=Nocardia sp. NPDC050710 TaxID=3157220 RepID=UPI0033F9943C